MSHTWPLAPLGEVASRVERPEAPIPGRVYRQLGVRLWGQGAYEREPLDGGATKYSFLSRLETGDIVVNKIWARNGSVAVVPAQLAGCYVSSEFPTFVPVPDQLDPRWFHWFTKTPRCWEQCDEKSRGTSGKNRIRPEKFLEIGIPLPPLNEQRRIVARIETLAAKIEEARGLRMRTQECTRRMLLAAYSSIVKGAKSKPMREVAPLKRRPAAIDPSIEYYELGIRSFGNGTFHKPAISGAQLGSKKMFAIEPGDLLFNIVFAWEGAVAVVKSEDKGRFGSHRFLACVPKDGVATSPFLCFHFLTGRGLEQLGEASPGGAGRNRTLGIEALQRLEVPLPPYGSQLWFNSIASKMESVAALRREADARVDSLLPSILARAFKGEL